MTGAQCPAPSVTFNEYSYHIIANQVQQDFIAICLLAGLYGVAHLQFNHDNIG